MAEADNRGRKSAQNTGRGAVKASPENAARNANTEDSAGQNTAFSGAVRVHESVLSSIVRKSTSSIPGVVRLAGNSFVDNIAEIVGSRRSFDRSVAIHLDGEIIRRMEIRIVAVYGAFLPDIAREVQRKVFEDVTNLTGMTIDKLDVVVMDVDDPDTVAVEAEPENKV